MTDSSTTTSQIVGYQPHTIREPVPSWNRYESDRFRLVRALDTTFNIVTFSYQRYADLLILISQYGVELNKYVVGTPSELMEECDPFVFNSVDYIHDLSLINNTDKLVYFREYTGDDVLDNIPLTSMYQKHTLKSMLKRLEAPKFDYLVFPEKNVNVAYEIAERAAALQTSPPYHPTEYNLENYTTFRLVRKVTDKTITFSHQLYTELLALIWNGVELQQYANGTRHELLECEPLTLQSKDYDITNIHTITNHRWLKYRKFRNGYVVSSTVHTLTGMLERLRGCPAMYLVFPKEESIKSHICDPQDAALTPVSRVMTIDSPGPSTSVPLVSGPIIIPNIGSTKLTKYDARRILASFPTDPDDEYLKTCGYSKKELDLICEASRSSDDSSTSSTSGNTSPTTME